MDKNYRNRMGLLYPTKIKNLRRHWKLSLRELSALTGISYPTLSNIENGKRVQSVSQNNILRYMLHGDDMYRLIMGNFNRIWLTHPAHVNFKKLIKLTERVGIPMEMKKP